MRVPVAVGAKTICTVHVALTASVCPAQLSVSLKSPVVTSVVKVSGALPLLVTVSVCAGDCVCTCCGAKAKLLEESCSAGCARLMAVSSGICHMPRP